MRRGRLLRSRCAVGTMPRTAPRHARLQDQLQLFVHFDEGLVQVPTMAGMAAPSQAETEADANQLNRYLLKKVDELELSVRSGEAALFL